LSALSKIKYYLSSLCLTINWNENSILEYHELKFTPITLNKTIMNNSFLSVKLTNAEILILQLIAYEYSTKEIANFLDVCDQSVYTHRANLLRKSKCKSKAIEKSFYLHCLRSILIQESNLNLKGQLGYLACT